MPASRQWTAGALFRHVMAELQADNQIAGVQRFAILSQIQNTIAAQFYNVMWQTYMTPVILSIDVTANWATTNTSTWTAATSTLTAANMNAAFLSTDVGKLVVFRKGASFYTGYLSTFVDSTHVKLSGYNLPTVDVSAIDTVDLVPTEVNQSIINLSTLGIMLTGEQVRLQLHSSATTDVESVSAEEVRVFRVTAPQNSMKIVWNYSGDELIFAYGNGVLAAGGPGTLTMRYPRVPIPLVADTDYMDLPDGIPMELAKIRLRKVLETQYALQGANIERDVPGLVSELYKNAGIMVSQEEIKSKVAALS